MIHLQRKSDARTSLLFLISGPHRHRKKAVLISEKAEDKTGKSAGLAFFTVQSGPGYQPQSHSAR
jgi:predicted pyridoxine 5'-phosphate oxidase superfamily flavin-nucleotide-binding protein